MGTVSQYWLQFRIKITRIVHFPDRVPHHRGKPDRHRSLNGIIFLRLDDIVQILEGREKQLGDNVRNLHPTELLQCGRIQVPGGDAILSS